MAYSAIMQKLQYHAKSNGYIIRNIAGSYFVMETATKEFITGAMSLNQLKMWIVDLVSSRQLEKLKNNFAV